MTSEIKGIAVGVGSYVDTPPFTCRNPTYPFHQTSRRGLLLDASAVEYFPACTLPDGSVSRDDILVGQKRAYLLTAAR